MYIIKVLKRKDASSVAVAVVLALIIATVLQVLTFDLSNYLSGIEPYAGTNWRESIVRPLIAAGLELIALEALLRVIISVRPFFVSKKHK